MAPERHASAGNRETIEPMLIATIERIIREHPEGLSEHALINRLRAARAEPFAGSNLRAPLSLFRTHFLLFHCLYRLRDACAEQGEWLRIDCLDIGLEANPGTLQHSESQGADRPAITDPLRNYYLDLTRLDTTDAAAVEALLGAFWQRMNRNERRSHALAVLGLEDPIDDQAIQQRYRSLVQRHHPDRGGDADQVQRFNEARWILLATG